MMRSTTSRNDSFAIRFLRSASVFVFWIAVWSTAAYFVGKEILIESPENKHKRDYRQRGNANQAYYKEENCEKIENNEIGLVCVSDEKSQRECSHKRKRNDRKSGYAPYRRD